VKLIEIKTESLFLLGRYLLSINYLIEWNGIYVTFHGSSILITRVKLVADEETRE